MLKPKFCGTGWKAEMKAGDLLFLIALGGLAGASNSQSNRIYQATAAYGHYLDRVTLYSEAGALAYYNGDGVGGDPVTEVLPPFEYLRSVTYQGGGMIQFSGCGVSFSTNTGRQLVFHGEMYGVTEGIDGPCDADSVYFSASTGNMLTELTTTLIAGFFRVSGIETERAPQTSSLKPIAVLVRAGNSLNGMNLVSLDYTRTYFADPGTETDVKQEALGPTEYLKAVTHKASSAGMGCLLVFRTSMGRLLRFSSEQEELGQCESSTPVTFTARDGNMITALISNTGPTGFTIDDIETWTAPSDAEEVTPPDDAVTGVEIRRGEYIYKVVFQIGSSEKSYSNGGEDLGVSEVVSLQPFETITTVRFKAGGGDKALACSITLVTTMGRTLSFQGTKYDVAPCTNAEEQTMRADEGGAIDGFQVDETTGQISGIEQEVVILQTPEPVSIRVSDINKITVVTNKYISALNFSSPGGMVQSYHHNAPAVSYNTAYQLIADPTDIVTEVLLEENEHLAELVYRGPSDAKHLGCRFTFKTTTGRAIVLEGTAPESEKCASPARRGESAATADIKFTAASGRRISGLMVQSNPNNGDTNISGILTEPIPPIFIPPCPYNQAELHARILGAIVAGSVALSVLKALSFAARTAMDHGERDWSALSGFNLPGVALVLIGQVQYAAVIGGIGGHKTLPEGAREFSDELGWINFHLFNGINITQSNTCEMATSNSKLELMSTFLTVLGGVLALSLLRVLAQRVFWKVAQKMGWVESEILPPFPFLSWELKAGELSILGLSESAGLALGSHCAVYSGVAVTVLCVGILIVWVVKLSVSYGLRWQKLIYHDRQKSFRNEYQAGKIDFSSNKDVEGCTGFWKRKVNAFEQALVRGNWVNHETPDHEQHHFHIDVYSNFSRRYAALFDSFQERWVGFPFWILIRDVAMGVALGTLTDPLANTISVLCIRIMDLMLIGYIMPWNNRFVLAIAFFTSSIQLVHCFVLCLYLNGVSGTNDCDLVNKLHVFLSWVGAAPAILAIFLFQSQVLLRVWRGREQYVDTDPLNRGFGRTKSSKVEVTSSFVISLEGIKDGYHTPKTPKELESTVAGGGMRRRTSLRDTFDFTATESMGPSAAAALPPAALSNLANAPSRTTTVNTSAPSRTATSSSRTTTESSTGPLNVPTTSLAQSSGKSARAKPRHPPPILTY